MKTKSFCAAIPALLLIFTPLAAKKASDAASKFKEKLNKQQQAEHVISRLSFGARPGDIEAVQKLGTKKWIDQQLDCQSIPENPALEATHSQMPTLALSTEALVLKYPTPQVLTAVSTGRMKMPEDPEL